MKSFRAPNRRPNHPGAILREDVLPELKITEAEFARLIGIDSLIFSEFLHERRPLNSQLAIRIATLLRTTPESWLRMQEALDLWEVRQRKDS